MAKAYAASVTEKEQSQDSLSTRQKQAGGNENERKQLFAKNQQTLNESCGYKT